MAHKVLLAGILLFGYSISCFAQFYPTQYRPPNQQWQLLKTDHFKLLYAEGNDSIALKMGHLLEDHYTSVQQLVGGELNNFPVILNDYNDRSNGFVTPLHFRSEIELPPIIGKALNPKTGNWLANVGPHELVHALQMSNRGEYNIPHLVSLFSPDMARAIHGAIPSGMLEGIAVHYESEQVSPDGGRGNFPYFTQQFQASFNSDRRWSMGQLMHISTNTRPFNRHYIGGYTFSSWLQQQYGSSTTRQALDFYMDYPFLGYGVALRHVTGKWPGQLYNRFEEDQEQTIQQKENDSNNFLPIPYKGRDIRRPKWINENMLLFYGSFYNARPGFYIYNITTKNLDHVLTTGSVGDYHYDLSDDRSEIAYSYFKEDPIYNNTSKAEIVRFNLNSHKKDRLTNNGRVYAPEYRGEELLALQTLPASSQLVRIAPGDDGTASIEKFLSIEDAEIIAVDLYPSPQNLAVVANHKGRQALWISSPDTLSNRLHKDPDLSFTDGSIFDPEWHPEGDRLLFSSDFSGTLQLYEYHIQKNQITQVTNASYNALEGSYSPDGNRIAFIKQIKNERLPAIISREDFDGHIVKNNLPKSVNYWRPADMVSDSIISASETWETGTYTNDLGWLKPRTLLPVTEEIGNRDVYQIGVGLHSNNLLQSQSYSAELTYLQDRLWYDLTYQNKTFFPGFKARFSSEPSYLSFNVEEETQTITHTLLRQSRNLSLSVPIQVRLYQNIYSTSFFIEPELRQSQMRFFEIGGTTGHSNFANTTATNIYSQFNYRLQQNIRDIQPNSGFILYSEIEHYLNAEDLDFTAYDNSITYSLQQASALQGGMYAYISPLRRWNQSLRIGLQGITQTNLIFDNQSLVSEGFSESVLPGSQHLLSFNTRYTIPLAFVDDGGFLLPLYLSNVYLVAFSDTVMDPTYSDWYHQSRSVFGIELRTHFRLSNLALDIGVGIGYEPTRGEHQFFIGNF